MTVKELIKVLLEYRMDAEVTGVNGEEFKTIGFLSRTTDDIYIEFKQISIEHPKIIEANADYTGGGIYIYYGKFSNGNYLFGSSEWADLYECNADPNCEEAFETEWCDKHCIKQIVGKQYKKYLKEWLKWILKHKPKGNYNPDELENYISEETK